MKKITTYNQEGVHPVQQGDHEQAIYKEMLQTYLQHDRATPESLKEFLYLLWDKAYPEDKSLNAQSIEFRVYWATKILRKLVADGRTTRSTAFRCLEEHIY